MNVLSELFTCFSNLYWSIWNICFTISKLVHEESIACDIITSVTSYCAIILTSIWIRRIYCIVIRNDNSILTLTSREYIRQETNSCYILTILALLVFCTRNIEIVVKFRFLFILFEVILSNVKDTTKVVKFFFFFHCLLMFNVYC